MPKRSRNNTPPPYDDDMQDRTPDPTKAARLDPAGTVEPAILCSAKPLCQARPFVSYQEYEVHYAQQHTNRCLECHNNFPSERFLNLHIAENRAKSLYPIKRHPHGNPTANWIIDDPLSKIKMERGEKIFGCFVDGCDRICSTSFNRRRHLIDKHHFPVSYNFGIIKTGVDNSTSLLNPSNGRATSKGYGGPLSRPCRTPILAVQGNDENGQDRTEHNTAIGFVPKSVKFGRRGGGPI